MSQSTSSKIPTHVVSSSAHDLKIPDTKTPARAREDMQAKLDAEGKGKKWYSDNYIPPGMEYNYPIAPYGVYQETRVDQAMFGSNTKKNQPTKSTPQLYLTQARANLSTVPMVDGVHTKSGAQIQREEEQAQKAARRARALAGGKAPATTTKKGFTNPPPRPATTEYKTTPLPVKSSSRVRAYKGRVKINEHNTGEVRERWTTLLHIDNMC